MQAQSSNIRENLKALPIVGKIGRTIAGSYRRSKRAFGDWWSQGIRYPALVDVRIPWSEYEAKLPRKGIYYLRKSFRLNLNCEYQAVEKLDAALLQRFASLWDRFYKLPPDFVPSLIQTYDKGWLRTRVARDKGEVVSIQFIEQYGRYALCQPPFYDKDALYTRSFGSYMWFQLIRHATLDSTLDFLDLGGGPVSHMPPDAYKLRYGPQDFGYRMKTCLRCGYMWPFMKLNETVLCKNCGRSVGIWRYAARLKFPKKEW